MSWRFISIPFLVLALFLAVNFYIFLREPLKNQPEQNITLRVGDITIRGPKAWFRGKHNDGSEQYFAALNRPFLRNADGRVQLSHPNRYTTGSFYIEVNPSNDPRLPKMLLKAIAQGAFEKLPHPPSQFEGFRLSDRNGEAAIYRELPKGEKMLANDFARQTVIVCDSEELTDFNGNKSRFCKLRTALSSKVVASYAFSDDWWPESTWADLIDEFRRTLTSIITNSNSS